MTTEQVERELEALALRAADGEDVREDVKQLRAAWLALVAAWLAANVPKAWVEGAEMIPGALAPAHTEMASLMADLAMERYRAAFDVATRSISDIYARSTMAKAQGTWASMARQIRADMQAHGVTVFRDKLGREWSLKRYSEMVSRTTLQQAKNEAAKTRLIEHGFDLAIITGPVPGERPACAHYAGMVVSLTGATPGYPTLSQYTSAGGFGPNCRHGLGAYKQPS